MWYGGCRGRQTAVRDLASFCKCLQRKKSSRPCGFFDNIAIHSFALVCCLSATAQSRCRAHKGGRPRLCGDRAANIFASEAWRRLGGSYSRRLIQHSVGPAPREGPALLRLPDLQAPREASCVRRKLEDFARLVAALRMFAGRARVARVQLL